MKYLLYPQVAGLLTSLVLQTQNASAVEPTLPKPNILLIVSDDQGYGEFA